ncbi:MAG: amidohydrolase [Gemmatimonadetes bacterium]|nr:amidohydrolase [Gemmatimonadota bacterium]
MFPSSKRRLMRLAATAVLLAACARPEPADLVLRNGKIVTMDSARPEAQAIAITGYTITAVGSNRRIGRYVGPNTEVIDLAGQLAVPGFIEGHGHFMGLGGAKMILDLTTATSWDDIVAMVAQAARSARPGEWIRGRGWHQEKWTSVPEPAVDGVPVHASLSRVSPNNPVYLTHASGHAAFVNGRALQLAGISRGTRNPPGGEIVHDASGNASGLLRETAQRLVGRAMDQAEAGRTPEDVEAQLREQVRLAGEDALAKGVTSFHDAGASFETIDFYKKLEAEGVLPVRLYAMVRRESNEEMAEKLPRYRMVAEGNDFLTVRSIKRQIDGALGSHGAWLLEPYVDMPASTGLVLEPVEDITRTAELAIQHGFQVNTHAIGDRGNREVLDLYAKVFAANPDKRDVRWRIEHAQHLHPDDIKRFAELGVIASMQGVHATSDGPWVPKRLGEERSKSGAYVWRSLLDAGAVVTNGTDVPVEDISPLASFYASVSRMTREGTAFYPEQRMTREEALRSYTLAAAYSAFEEAIKGSLSPGKLADVAVLSKDIMTVPEAEIPTAQVMYTIVGGKVAYRRPTSADDRR